MALLERHAAPEQWACLERAAELARESRIPVALVGGAARDLFHLGRLRDLDLVVEGDGPRFARALAERLEARVRVHPDFGTAEIDHPRMRVDVAGARNETYDRVAALPRVRPGTLAEDLARRDFTVNALAIRLGPAEAGRLIDPHGGLADLRRGALRVLHPRSFHDDPTRALRGVRLELRLGLRLEATTLAWLGEALADGAFANLTGDRLRRELELLFRQIPELGAVGERLDRLGLLAAVHPALALGRASRERLQRFDRARSRYAGDLEGAGTPSWLRFGLLALSWDLESDTRRKIAGRLGLGGEPLRRLVEGPVQLRELQQRLADRALAPHQADEALRPLTPEELLAVAADGGERVDRWVRRFVGEWRELSLGITGNDLLARGFSPGPAIGRALALTRGARIDGRIGADGELDFALEQLTLAGEAPATRSEDQGRREEDPEA